MPDPTATAPALQEDDVAAIDHLRSTYEGLKT